jgi:hypothetical protein
VEVELTSDLVQSAVVGDVVTVMGWVKVLATGDDLGGALQAKSHRSLSAAVGWNKGVWKTGWQ